MSMEDLMAAARVPDVIAANGFGYRRMRLSAFGKKIKSHRPGYSLKNYQERMMAAFGKKRRARKGCGVHRRRIDCAAAVGCTFKKGRGCIKKRKKVARISKTVPLGGDDDLGAYADEAGISFFGRRKVRRRRYNVPGSPCNRLTKRRCSGNPNCTYTKRGCRRRKGTAKKGVVYEGPSIAFGRRKSRKSRRKVRRTRRKIRRTRRKVRRTVRRVGRKVKKIPAKIRKLAKKLKIKITKKVGSKKIYKKLSAIKKQIARKMRSHRRR